MTAWAILTLALAVVMINACRDEFDREVERCNGDPTIPAAAFLATAASVSAPVALAWALLKAVVLAVLR